MVMIIETSAGQFYRVRETGEANLAHVWYGVRVKRAKDGFGIESKTSFVDCAKAREELVRKAGSHFIARIEPVEIVATLTTPEDADEYFGTILVGR